MHPTPSLEDLFADLIQDIVTITDVLPPNTFEPSGTFQMFPFREREQFRFGIPDLHRLSGHDQLLVAKRVQEIFQKADRVRSAMLLMAPCLRGMHNLDFKVDCYNSDVRPRKFYASLGVLDYAHALADCKTVSQSICDALRAIQHVAIGDTWYVTHPDSRHAIRANTEHDALLIHNSLIAHMDDHPRLAQRMLACVPPSTGHAHANSKQPGNASC